MTSKNEPHLCGAALELAARGWQVFPCHPRGPRAKAPLTAHGHHDATTDPDVIRSWWARWADALIGAPVPAPSVVLDVDPRNGGDVDELERIAGGLPDTLAAWSGRADGGRHLYFQRPTGPLTSTRLPDGVDLKSSGYCIVPPSPHPATGEPYRWEHRPVAPLPRGLRELLRPAPQPVRRPSQRGNADGLVRFVAGLQAGERNRGLYWSACRAVEAGQLDDVSEDLVRAAVAAGLSEVEARRSVQSAVRRVGVAA